MSLVGNLLQEAGLDSDVRCPGDFTPGEATMECEATFDGQLLHYAVELDDGDLSTETREVLMDVEYMEAWAVDHLGADTASCGDPRLLPVPVGATMTCQVTSAGATEPLVLKVLNPEGAFEPVP